MTESICEGVLSHRIQDVGECAGIWEMGEIPLLVDETGEAIKKLHPAAVIDAILAKKKSRHKQGNGASYHCSGTWVSWPVEMWIMWWRLREAMILEGSWKRLGSSNTGIPGMIGGYGKERVIHSPAAGTIHSRAKISDLVEKDQVIAVISTEKNREIPVFATISGVLRGMIREEYQVSEGMKIADIDPRKEQKKNCNTISDKARCIAGTVVEILLSEGIVP